jgi:hypothetical protein
VKLSTITTSELIMMTAERGIARFCVTSVLLCIPAVAQEGYYGVGHEHWHMEFYSKLNRNDGKGSCCNLYDCRPTQSRRVSDHYEVKVDVTRSIMWWRLMVALTSARRDRRVRTRVFYFASFCPR